MTINLTLEELAYKGIIDSSWVDQLLPVQSVLDQIAQKLNQEIDAGEQLLPSSSNILRAFTIPFDEVKVVIVGQDPYPTQGDAVGMSFSVSPERRDLPRSLRNIFTELHADIGCDLPATGDLSPWAEQGVMLLNRALTVRAGEAGSHRGIGWEHVTEQVLRSLNDRMNRPLVAVLWGNDAKSAHAYLNNSIVIESVHPSPLSASRGFFGSRPFSKVNTALVKAGQTPINWSLPTQSALF
ncbi:uracil-DNA glycosylase [Aurantimicrobium minutum]|uniref:uracil-DNA glycosylase n=1 Tax=Aurantimicrobium minutum TaxID=708131 RepID=UPI00247ED981|nr:uracil-DNA glycosylase [Aurantimicrobium minutum]